MSPNDSYGGHSSRTSKELGLNDDILCRIELLKSLQESFVCKLCGECCKQESIAFTEADIINVSQKKNLSSTEFIETYHLSSIKIPGDLEFYRLTIGELGVCPFCSDQRCTIYDARPQVCRGFPFLTPENVQNAFKMNNVIKLGSNCKTAIEQMERFYSKVPRTNEK